jgi:hypothetical protein
MGWRSPSADILKTMALRVGKAIVTETRLAEYFWHRHKRRQSGNEDAPRDAQYA